MTGVPQEAIDAAAKAIHEAGCGYVQCAQAGHPDVGMADRDLAETILEAAAPHIAAAERERIRGLAVARGATCPDGEDWPDRAAAAWPPPPGVVMFADLIREEAP